MNRFSTQYVAMVVGAESQMRLTSFFEYMTSIIHDHAPLYPELAPTRMINVEPFNTDLATIPWWITWWLNKLGAYTLPAILHDYMLQHRNLFPELSRQQIDLIFKEAMEDQGVALWKCRVMYAGVRLNSWWVEERFL